MKNSARAIFILLCLLAAAAEAATVTYTASGNWTAPAGVTSVTVEAWGGGGGGGAATGNPAKGGGGAGGQYAKKVVTVTPGNTYAIVVGAGGAVSTTTAGGAGGDSTFAATTVVAKGGAGGGLASANSSGGTAGVGLSTGGVGDVVYAGGSGSAGVFSNTGGAGGGGAGSSGAGGSASGNTAGTGTATGGGSGGAGIVGTTSSNGNAGSTAGGGGGGGNATGTTDRSGGAGASGQVFITYATVPTVTTNAASALTTTGATLNGTVSSNGASTTVTFDYGLTTTYGSTATATASPLPANAVNTAVSAAVTGLTCNTLYHYRVNGANSAGTTNGSDATFTTSACVPTVTTNAATAVLTTGATLNGTVSSNGASTTVTFDYGLTTGYGSTATATASPLAANAVNTAVSAAVTGLTCGTTYHFRVNGVNSAGTTNGGDQTFTTGACAVTLAKTVSTPAAITGSSPSFTIVATNSTPVALNNVVVSDNILTGLTYSSSSPTLGTVTLDAPTGTGQLVTWTIPFLPPGASAQLSITVQLTAPRGTFTNTATSPGAADSSATILVLSSAFTHYRLEDPAGWNGTAGEVYDSGVKHLSGRRRITAATSTTNTVVPNPTIASQHTEVVNSFCNAGSFDGNGVVETANSSFFHFGQTLSASAWIYPTAYPTGNNGQDLSSILSNDTNYEFHLDPGGHLYWWWNASNFTSAKVIPLNTWTHIAITLDSTSANARQRIYINGVADVNTNNWSGNLDTNPCPFYIGGDISTTTPQTTPPTCNLLPARNFHGMIDEVKIYDFELTADEVKADMTLGRVCGSSTFDHIQIEHDGTASVCAPKAVTVKPCMDAGCNTQYTGNVTVTLSPTGWIPSDTITITGGQALATLNKSSIVTPGITLGTTTNGVNPIPANATRCFNGSTSTCFLSVAATTCGFDAVEVGANPATDLYTKLASTAFDVDVLALNASGTVNTGYTGQVTVDLVDASSLACSATSTVLSTTQPTITFAAADKGRKTVTNLTCPTAAPGAQVRIRYGTSSVACSTDKLAVRPHAFALTTSAATSAGKTFKAGATTFTLNATAATYSQSATSMPQPLTTLPSYIGTPKVGTIDTSPMGAGIWVSGSLSLGTSLAAAVAGVSTNTPTYSEVGLFKLPGIWPSTSGYTASDNTSVRGIYDDTWANIDKNKNDCVVGSYSNQLNSSGMYGCNFGMVTDQTLGRFYPDHFETVISAASGVPMTCPTGLTCPASYNGFVYSGQAFTNLVTAKNLAGGTTQNYAGANARDVTLAAEKAVGSATAPSGAGTLNVTSAAASGFAAGTFTASSQKYTFTTTPTAPTDVYVSANEVMPGGDGVSSLLAVPANSVEGGVKVVSGRIKASSVYGSDLLPLTVKVMAQYYTSSGWVYSSTDGVTKLAPTYSGLATTKTLNPASGILNYGNLSIKLAAPGAAGTVTVTPTIDSASPGNPPLGIISGSAAFGVYKSNNNFIYRRESY